jgi:hypothetical protein
MLKGASIFRNNPNAIFGVTLLGNFFQHYHSYLLEIKLLCISISLLNIKIYRPVDARAV